MFCVPGGVCGDRGLGRYLTIVLFTSVYVAGVAVTAVATAPSISSAGLFLAGSFGGVALGSGGIKPNVCNFGADQAAAPAFASAALQP